MTLFRFPRAANLPFPRPFTARLGAALAGGSAAFAILLAQTSAEAACVRDKDCPGSEICEAGVCKTPPPGASTPAAQSPAGPQAGQPQTSPPYAGQPAPPYPAQPYPAQPYPAQPYPGQPYAGQPYPGQPYPGQPYPAQPQWGPPPGQAPYAGAPPWGYGPPPQGAYAQGQPGTSQWEAPRPPPQTMNADGSPRNRVALSLHIQPNLAASKAIFGFGGSAAFNVGVEWIPAIGKDFRYHGGFFYSNMMSQSGFRLEPATFGYVIPVHEQGGVRVEIEPTVALFQLQLFAPQQGGSYTFFSSGAAANLNVAYGAFFGSFSPVGFDVRYFAFATNGMASVSDGDGALDWRARLSLGVQY